MRIYSEGSRVALSRLGLEKMAFTPYQPPAPYQDGDPLLKSVYEHSKHQLIGDPTRAVQEFRNGDWKRKGSYIRSMLWNSQPAPANAGWFGRTFHRVSPGLNYVFPALGFMGAMQAPEEEKGKAWGSAAGNFAGAVLGTPFGILGSMAGTSLGGAIGSSIGGLFDKGH